MYAFNQASSGLPLGDQDRLEQHARMMGDYGRRMAEHLRRLEERGRTDPRYAPPPPQQQQSGPAASGSGDRRQHPAFLFDGGAHNSSFDHLFDRGFSHRFIFPPPAPNRPVVVEDDERRRTERRVWEAQMAAEQSRKEAERAYEMARQRALEEERQAIQTAWETYETRWATLLDQDTQQEPWTFESVPWPQYPTPSTPQDLRLHSMSRFLLADCHSVGVSVKDRIRSALLRWHPDKFMGKHLEKVRESDREKVCEGVNAVCRQLHTLQENLVRSPGA